MKTSLVIDRCSNYIETPISWYAHTNCYANILFPKSPFMIIFWKIKTFVVFIFVLYVQHTNQWCRRWGYRRCHPQKFWFVENPGKSLKIWAKSLKIKAKMAPNIIIKGDFAWLKKGTQRLQKNLWRPFFGGHTQKRSSWSLWEKKCRRKLHIDFLSQFQNCPV